MPQNLKIDYLSKKSVLVKALTQAVLASSLFLVPLAYADTTISTPTAATLLTSTAGNIIVQAGGQVNANDAIVVDAPTASPVVITLNSNNTNVVPSSFGMVGAALLSAADNGVNIQNGAPGTATVNVGSNTAIVGADAGVLIDNVGATITNNGLILTTVGGKNAIFIDQNGLGPTISNAPGAIIQGYSEPSIADNPGSPNGTQLVLVNSGTITTSQINVDAIELGTSFASITNNPGGIIRTMGIVPNPANGLGNGIEITGANPVTGAISNSGLISVTQGSGILINNDFTGTINNNVGGIIQTTSNGYAVLLKNDFSTLNNSGIIQATMNGKGISIENNPTTGTINNSGLVSTNGQPAIYISSNVGQINNSGTLTSSAAAGSGTIYGINTTILNGINNSGNIFNTGAGNAIYLEASANTNVTQSGGIISGDILLAGHDETGLTGNVFNMTGGVINGDIFARNVVPNTLTLGGGIINGTVTLGNMGDTLELSGTQAQAILGGAGMDKFLMSGGSFTSLDGNGNIDTMEVFGSFTAGSISEVEIMNLNAGTFTANGPITGLDTSLTIFPSAKMIVNNTATGTADIINDGNLTINGNVNIPTGDTTNNGVLNVNSGGILTTNKFTQSATGNFVVDVNGLNPLGAIQTTAGNVNIAGKISPSFSSGTYVPAGSTYDIIKTLGGTITDTSTISPASLVISFTKDVIVPCGAGECLELTAVRTPFAALPIPSSALGVAEVLDQLAIPPGPTNTDLQLLLAQLDIITDQEVLNNALVDLGPPVNYALPMTSRIIMNSSFNSVQRRLKDLTGLAQFGFEDYSAYRRMDRNANIFVETGENFGDQAAVHCGSEGCFYKVVPGRIRRNQVGLWAEGFGAVIDQAFRDNVEGYHAEAGGAMIGFDAGDLTSATIGAALSWVNIHNVSRNDTHNVLDVIGYQGTVYGWFSPWDGLFIDTIMGFATQKYRQRRNININDAIVRTAFSKFYGVNYGIQTDVGYGVLYKSVIIAPMIRSRFSRLSIDNYTEEGSGGLNLAVRGSGYNEFLIGGGLRLGGKINIYDAIYSPEASALIMYDCYGNSEAYVANFLGGGGPFLTQGNRPAKLFSLYSLSVTAETDDGYIATLRYDLEVRDHFFGNAGYFQLRYQWG